MKNEQRLETLIKSSGQTDFQLSAEAAQQISKVIEPGKAWNTRQVELNVSKDVKMRRFWQVDEGQTLSPGVYAMTAVMTMNNPQSEWKGEVVSGVLQVEIK